MRFSAMPFACWPRRLIKINLLCGADVRLTNFIGRQQSGKRSVQASRYFRQKCISMELEDKTWGLLEGGYRIPYDASKPLKKLKGVISHKERQELFHELWENLHHQGDVGLASYLAVPHLIDICIENKSLDWNFIGLCVAIESCRINGKNPELPSQYDDLYFSSLTKFEKYLLANLKNINDRTGFRLALALLATVNGQPELGRAIEVLDEDVVDDFLSRF